jgi:hypothetical protein
VKITGAAGPNGTTVTVQLNTGPASTPSTVVIAAGGTAKYFTISTTPTSTTLNMTCKATLAGKSQSAVFTVQAPPVKSLTFSPSSVKGGAAVSGVVRLGGVAGPNGLEVTLSGGDSSVSYPKSVTVPAGSTQVNFNVTTYAVTSNHTNTIQAANGSTNASATLTVTP